MNAVPTLIIGNKALSSWSLRPWLLMKAFDLPFEEVKVRFRQPTTRANILAHSPTGLVPALKDGDIDVWDSLAIAEYLADKHRDKALWPEASAARAHARSITAEMHSGFADLRTIWPMDAITQDARVLCPQAVRKDLDRVFAIWTQTLDRFGGQDGPFLFGRFAIPDAFYAPIALRIRPFGPVPMPPAAASYYTALLAHPAMKEWMAGAQEEVAAGWYNG